MYAYYPHSACDLTRACVALRGRSEPGDECSHRSHDDDLKTSASRGKACGESRGEICEELWWEL